ncbi:regulatory protein ral2, partial [Fistulina hepatica ATCC 64428]
MLHSIYDLTTFSRKTTGDVPAKLVGASTTVIGAKLYLFGGRLVSERRMVSDLYSFDLATYRWERVPFHPEDDAPTPRYFHSADSWCGQLVVFGGMSTQPESPNPDELCVLNDVRFFDLATGRWAPPSPEDPLAPRARYAHLSSVSNSRLFVIGGQDFYNTWLDDVCVYDLVRRRWVLRRDYPHHCGTYRSIAVSSETCVRFPSEEKHDGELGSFATPEDRLIHMSYSAPPTDDYPCDIYLYSNYNFTNVKRELEVFSPLPGNDFVVNDRSADMSGEGLLCLPPGLRFPTGALLGNHLIVCGTYLAHSYQSFSIWALDLQPEKSHPNNHPAHPSHHRSNSRTSAPMRWTRIDPGRAVETGSWFRSALWTSRSQLFVFGNRNGNLVDDYNRRLLSWEHVAVVDLEAFGIYAPPGHADAPPTMYKSPSSEPRVFDIPAQVMGLSVLEQGLLTDFEIVCSDGRRIAVSRRVLEERWPWFHNEMARTRSQGRALADKNADVTEVSLPPLPGSTVINNLDESVDDPRLTPRSMVLPEQYPVSLAFVQYLYARALITPLQHAPAVLSQLLVLATTYNMDHLRALVKHAMHGALTNTTSVGVYEVATLCNCRSLQIRWVVLSAVFLLDFSHSSLPAIQKSTPRWSASDLSFQAYTTKKGSRSKSDKSRPQGPDGHGGGVYGGPDASHGPGGSGGYGGGLIRTRPRGTSDAMWRTVGEG